ncbi:MAG: ABC transporter ATP-binding protein [Phycisphaerae bacterium]
MTNTLTADAIVKHYPTRGDPLVVLDGVSLSLQRGEAVAIMGPSGSGKSTLLNILGALEPPTAGRIRLDAVDPFALSQRDLARLRNERIGLIFQDHHLLPQCSVFENVLLPTLPYHRGEPGAERARTLLHRVGLSDRLEHMPAELSGGERQRVAVARALMNHPALVLADEPTGNLDRASADVVGDLLTELHRAESLMLVVVTHSVRLAQRFPRRLELIDGRLTPNGDTRGAR